MYIVSTFLHYIVYSILILPVHTHTHTADICKLFNTILLFHFAPHTQQHTHYIQSGQFFGRFYSDATVMRIVLSSNYHMYVSKLQNVFSLSAKCISVQYRVAKCICQNCKIICSQIAKVFFPIAKCISVQGRVVE